MKKVWSITLILSLLLTAVAAVQAQDEAGNGRIRGAVHVDVNGDGKCIGTGVAGEIGVANVPIELTNGEGGLVMKHTTGSDGTFGIVAVGQSFWEVTVLPGNDWKVTSEATRSALISDDNREVEGVNFCIQPTNQARGTLLPQAGGTVSAGLTAVTALTALILIAIGLLLQSRRRA